MIIMDLTKNFPRSPYDMLVGIVMLPRTIDKCRATIAGTNGEYHYGCPMDAPVLKFLDVSKEEFMKKVKELKTDDAIEKLVNGKLAAKNKKDIAKFNNEMRHMKPNDESSRKWLESEKNRLGRNDYFTYFDNLDADEGRF
ncbi:DUF5069 domain-containing protein [Candidatus Woesearchaeota archaeon]|nr:DUF5069 domain-containing protein [Candidatus Woesearchaeota archaeon]